VSIARRSVIRVEPSDQPDSTFVTLRVPASLLPRWMKPGVNVGVIVMDSGEMVLVPTLARTVVSEFRRRGEQEQGSGGGRE